MRKQFSSFNRNGPGASIVCSLLRSSMPLSNSQETYRFLHTCKCTSSSNNVGSDELTSPIKHLEVEKQKTDTLGLYSSLSEWDPTLYQLIEEETARQRNGLELIASENFVSPSVMECLGSTLTNKYAEGRPGLRYYGGADVVDKIERLAEERALAAFHLSPHEWAVNVQPYSGSPANFAVYMASLTEKQHIARVPPPQESGVGDDNPRRASHAEEETGGLMGLHLTCGGHLTHGFFTPQKRVSASSLFFRSTPYYTNPQTGLVDYDGMQQLARKYRPNLVIAGGSAYPRDWDYRRFRDVCNEIGALLMVDMAHTAGLIAAGQQRNPFDFADVVTTTTHKTLRGPRAGMIFVRRRQRADESFHSLPQQIHSAVFPGLQGGPHLHQIAAIATQMKAVASSQWREYACQVIQNAQALGSALQKRGEVLVTGGTDNHMILWDLRPHLNKLEKGGTAVEHALEAAHISVNRNTLPGDSSARLHPSGIRLGTVALTTRGVVRPEDWDYIADLLSRGLQLTKSLGLPPPSSSPPGMGSTKKKDRVGRKAYIAWLQQHPELLKLRQDVSEFAASFPLPGDNWTSSTR